MRVCVLTFQPPATGGGQTQVITGVEDEEGPFVGTWFVFQSAYAAINTVTSGGFPLNAYMDGRGLAQGALFAGGSGVANVTADVLLGGIKDSASMHSEAYSVTDFNAQFSTGGAGWRQAYVSAIGLGTFSITYDENDRTGDTVLVTVFGGDDLTFDEITAISSGVKGTSPDPQGLITFGVSPLDTDRGAQTGAGGEDVNRGWDTKDGIRGSSYVGVPLGQDYNNTAQFTDTFIATAGAGGVQVTDWGATSITIANTGGSGGPSLVVCGANIRTAAGTLTQPMAPGVQTFTTGIDARWICFISNGYPADSGLQTVTAETVVGWGTNILTQVGFWTAENGDTHAAHGARYLSDSTVLRFGVPNTTSTTFSAVASLTALNDDGTASITWSSVDATPRQILWFVIGTATAPPPPPPVPVFRTREVVRRRLRRAPIVWSEKGGLQTRVRINLFAVDMQPGVGTSDTPDPLVMIRASKDGGFTWGNERRLSAGRVGEFFNRINAWQWGQGRDWVFEVSCTDPVLWNLVGAYLDAEGGDN